MPSIYTPNTEENDVEDVEQEAAEGQTTSLPLTDSRRRRAMKRGDVVTPDVPDASQTTAKKDRPTPSQRREVTVSTNPIVRVYQNFRQYLREVQDELGKVSWLSREDTLRLTRIVLVVTAAAAAFLGFVSFLFALLTQALATPGSTIGAGILAVLLIVGVSGAWLFRDRLFPGQLD